MPPQDTHSVDLLLSTSKLGRRCGGKRTSVCLLSSVSSSMMSLPAVAVPPRGSRKSFKPRTCGGVEDRGISLSLPLLTQPECPFDRPFATSPVEGGLHAAGWRRSGTRIACSNRAWYVKRVEPWRSPGLLGPGVAASSSSCVSSSGRASPRRAKTREQAHTQAEGPAGWSANADRSGCGGRGATTLTAARQSRRSHTSRPSRRFQSRPPPQPGKQPTGPTRQQQHAESCLPNTGGPRSRALMSE